MNILEKYLKEKGPFMMCHSYYGDPGREFSQKLIARVSEAGADILEIGIPFSDPVADGPTFIDACTRAIKSGTKPRHCISAVRELRKKGITKPIVVTSYYNLVLQYGADRFMADIKAAGADGLIIPDLVMEEAGPIIESCRKKEICFIFLVGPNSSEKRIMKIAEHSTGFIYAAARSGVTGEGENIENQAIKKTKVIAKLPVLVGFGISGKKQARRAISMGADGIIIGSAIAKIYSRYIMDGKMENEGRCLDEIFYFIKGIRKEIDKKAGDAAK